MNDFQKGQVDRCIEQLEILNEWEQGFIESLSDLGDDIELSDKQTHKLNACDTKVCQNC